MNVISLRPRPAVLPGLQDDTWQCRDVTKNLRRRLVGGWPPGACTYKRLRGNWMGSGCIQSRDLNNVSYICFGTHLPSGSACARYETLGQLSFGLFGHFVYGCFLELASTLKRVLGTAPPHLLLATNLENIVRNLLLFHRLHILMLLRSGPLKQRKIADSTWCDTSQLTFVQFTKNTLPISIFSKEGTCSEYNNDSGGTKASLCLAYQTPPWRQTNIRL